MPTKPEHLWYDVKYFDHLKSKRWYTYKAQLENIATAEEERAALFRRSPHFKSVIVRCEVITTATPLTLEPAERVAAFLSSK
jgi:hypothetical protein